MVQGVALNFAFILIIFAIFLFNFLVGFNMITQADAFQ